jgi:hypothetical protein
MMRRANTRHRESAVAVPVAAGIICGTGFLMTPAVGAVFMSTIIVAVNAQLLRFYRRNSGNGFRFLRKVHLDLAISVRFIAEPIPVGSM